MERIKLGKDQAVMLTEAIRLKDMEQMVDAGRNHVEIDFDMRIVIIRRNSADIVVPFENVRFIKGAFPAVEGARRAKVAQQ